MICDKKGDKEFFRDKEHEPISFKFRLIHESFAAMLNRQLKEVDLTFSQFILVLYLWENRDKKVNQKDISKALHIKHPTTIGLLKRLEEKEMLKVVVDPDNRKYRNITLTKKGEDFAVANQKRRKNTDSYLTNGMTEDEIKELRRLLDKVNDNLEEIAKKTDKTEKSEKKS